MLEVSNYARSGRHPNAVAISNGVPAWFRGRVYKKLAPPWSAVKASQDRRITDERFEEIYREHLNKLDPVQVCKDLGDDAILLCWEKPGDFCHRQILANWLQEQLGLVVPECGCHDPNHPTTVEITTSAKKKAKAEAEAAEKARLKAEEEERNRPTHQQLNFFGGSW